MIDDFRLLTPDSRLSGAGECDVETLAEAATIAFRLGWRLEVVAQRILWRPKSDEGKQ